MSKRPLNQCEPIAGNCRPAAALSEPSDKAVFGPSQSAADDIIGLLRKESPHQLVVQNEDCSHGLSIGTHDADDSGKTRTSTSKIWSGMSAMSLQQSHCI